MPATVSDSAFLDKGGFGRLSLQGAGQDSRRLSLVMAVTNLRMCARSGLTFLEGEGSSQQGSELHHQNLLAKRDVSCSLWPPGCGNNSGLLAGEQSSSVVA